MKVAFLDRDGTINKDYEDQEWRQIVEPELIEGAPQALKEIRNKGYQIIVVTNQYIIGEGIVSLEQYEKFSKKLVEELKKEEIDLLDIFYCPHSKKEGCTCCKPNTGLIRQALEKYPSIELDKSFLVGDSPCDVELGNRLGIKTFGIQVNSKDNSKDNSYIPLKNVSEIVEYLD